MLKDLDLEKFFVPLDERVTLSSEVGVEKPDERIFRASIDKIKKGLPYDRVFFVTEDKTHIEAAGKLGIVAIWFNRFKDTNNNSYEKINSLIDLNPLINSLLKL